METTRLTNDMQGININNLGALERDPELIRQRKKRGVCGRVLSGLLDAFIFPFQVGAQIFCCCLKPESRDGACFCISWLFIFAATVAIATYGIVVGHLQTVSDIYLLPSRNVYSHYLAQKYMSDIRGICSSTIQPMFMAYPSVALVNSGGVHDEFVLRKIVQEGTRVSTMTGRCMHEGLYTGDFKWDCMSETWYNHMALVSFDSYDALQKAETAFAYTPHAIVNVIDNPFEALASFWTIKEACKDAYVYWQCLSPDINLNYFLDPSFPAFARDFIVRWVKTQEALEKMNNVETIYINDLIVQETCPKTVLPVLGLISESNYAYAEPLLMQGCINTTNACDLGRKYHVQMPETGILKDDLRNNLCEILGEYWIDKLWGEC